MSPAQIRKGAVCILSLLLLVVTALLVGIWIQTLIAIDASDRAYWENKQVALGLALMYGSSFIVAVGGVAAWKTLRSAWR